VTDEDSGARDGALPKLTIGQRILTALPSLQRQAPPARSSSPSPRATPTASSPTGAEADGPIGPSTAATLESFIGMLAAR